MTDHMSRQPLSVLSNSNTNGNVLANAIHHSPTSVKKRSHEHFIKDTKHAQPVAVTPKKASQPPVANGRRSVKRVKVDIDATQAEDALAAKQRAQAEAEYRMKMKAWVASYKREFPTLRFYFDACPDDDVRRCSRKIAFLGGSVEQFFSNAVNVVVTTRDINKLSAGTSHSLASSAAAVRQVREMPLAAALAFKTAQFPGHLGIRMHESRHRLDPQSHDVLIKAQNLNMKIWSLKKLRDSVLKNLVSEHTQPANERSLSSTLHTEKFVGFGEENIGQFKGPYLLVRDMNEEYRPIMCREWSNVVSAKDGEWPQWRSTKPGRCPFIRDKRVETQKTSARTGEIRPMYRAHMEQFNHANASGIQQITSAIQSNVGRCNYGGKENFDSGVSSLLKKAVTAKRSLLPTNLIQTESTDSKKKPDQKGGFCENCKEKFDDFDHHLSSRAHKAYAKNEKNFADLDDLLKELVRGPVGQFSDDSE